MTEAEKVSELHQEVKNGLVNDDVEKVKNWQKEAYHKQMIGGFKEAKEAEEGFKKAQKPWAKKLKEVRANLHSLIVSKTSCWIVLWQLFIVLSKPQNFNHYKARIHQDDAFVLMQDNYSSLHICFALINMN